MEKSGSNKYRDLEERTFRFARDCRDFLKTVPRTPANIEYGKQLIRSSGSQAANYIEANESLSKRDFAFRIKICRKEAKESDLWLNLLDITSESHVARRDELINEVGQLRKIFTAILNKST